MQVCLAQVLYREPPEESIFTAAAPTHEEALTKLMVQVMNKWGKSAWDALHDDLDAHRVIHQSETDL